MSSIESDSAIEVLSAGWRGTEEGITQMPSVAQLAVYRTVSSRCRRPRNLDRAHGRSRRLLGKRTLSRSVEIDAPLTSIGLWALFSR